MIFSMDVSPMNVLCLSSAIDWGPDPGSEQYQFSQCHTRGGSQNPKVSPHLFMYVQCILPHLTATYMYLRTYTKHMHLTVDGH